LKSNQDVTRQRLHNQFITRPTFEKPGDVVRWLGAVQAQDFLGSLWAIGLRMHGAVESDIEQAIADRDIVRTWPMRGTIHFVPAEDIRWMLKLMASRVIAGNGARLQRQFGFDAATVSIARKAVTQALQGGKRIIRSKLYTVLEDAGVPTVNGRGLILLGWLAHEGIICFGARQGKQATFVLLDEWIEEKRAKNLTREEALAELAKRYFTGHGPATVHDFAWWTGLTLADCRAGIEMVGPLLAQEEVEGKTYWVAVDADAAPNFTPDAHLLPPFDEYTVAYKDRSAILDPAHVAVASVAARGSVLNSVIEINGRIVGNWKRTFEKGSVVITLQPFDALTDAEGKLVAEGADRYGRFLDMPVILP
jgi:Winged helix DNA-binding domain